MRDLEMSAASLYDGGWRAEDKEELISEYQLTEKEAVELIEELISEYQLTQRVSAYGEGGGRAD